MTGKRHQRDPDLDAKISVLYQAGLSTYQISRQLNMTQYRVMASLERTGTQKRSPGDARKLRGAI